MISEQGDWNIVNLCQEITPIICIYSCRPQWVGIIFKESSCKGVSYLETTYMDYFALSSNVNFPTIAEKNLATSQITFGLTMIL